MEFIWIVSFWIIIRIVVCILFVYFGNVSYLIYGIISCDVISV